MEAIVLKIREWTGKEFEKNGKVYPPSENVELTTLSLTSGKVQVDNVNRAKYDEKFRPVIGEKLGNILDGVDAFLFDTETNYGKTVFVGVEKMDAQVQLVPKK